MHKTIKPVPVPEQEMKLQKDCCKESAYAILSKDNADNDNAGVTSRK